MSTTAHGENKGVVLALLDAIAGRETETLKALVHEDVVWWVPVSSAGPSLERPLVGRDAVVGLLNGGHGFFKPETTTWTALRLVEEEGTVIAHVRRQCLTSRDMPYDNEYMLRFDMADGCITAVWEQTDTAYASACLAAKPPSS